MRCAERHSLRGRVRVRKSGVGGVHNAVDTLFQQIAQHYGNTRRYSAVEGTGAPDMTRTMQHCGIRSGTSRPAPTSRTWRPAGGVGILAFTSSTTTRVETTSIPFRASHLCKLAGAAAWSHDYGVVIRRSMHPDVTTLFVTNVINAKVAVMPQVGHFGNESARQFIQWRRHGRKSSVANASCTRIPTKTRMRIASPVCTQHV